MFCHSCCYTELNIRSKWAYSMWRSTHRWTTEHQSTCSTVSKIHKFYRFRWESRICASANAINWHPMVEMVNTTVAPLSGCLIRRIMHSEFALMKTEKIKWLCARQSNCKRPLNCVMQISDCAGIDVGSRRRTIGSQHWPSGRSQLCC